MLRDSLIDNHQPNETILVYGVGDDGGYTTVGFHQLGCTREGIVADYAPELSPWLATPQSTRGPSYQCRTGGTVPP